MEVRWKNYKSEGGKVRSENSMIHFRRLRIWQRPVSGASYAGIPYHETGILYRLQNQSALIEQALTRNGIPVHVAGKKNGRHSGRCSGFPCTSGLRESFRIPRVVWKRCATKRMERDGQRKKHYSRSGWETDGTLPKKFSIVFRGW